MSTMTTKEIRKRLESGDPTQIEMIDPEDLEIFKENEEERNMITLDGIKSLYAGIAEQAVQDYKKLHLHTMHKKANPAMYAYGIKPIKEIELEEAEKEIEKYFNTEFFKNVTGIKSREKLISAIEKTIIEERKKKLQLGMA